ncbi:MAG: methyltransferase domain-containing protein [Deltaproteobacteria bacterium]|nr:methyltransferase domain-containing protein [Deltaproteobacteria bacterium]
MDWSQLIRGRELIHKRYPQIWDLKLIKRPSRLVQDHLRPGMSVLEAGASDRRMERRIKQAYPDIVYKSMDIDRGLPHDYYSLDEIDEQFDLIILLEVIEHLELEEGMKMLRRINELLVDGGKLIISTPNIYNPGRFWIDATHKVAYSYEELGGILLSQGFEVLEIYRTFNASVPKYLLRLTLFHPLHRILNVDFAKSIVVLAQKRGCL